MTWWGTAQDRPVSWFLFAVSSHRPQHHRQTPEANNSTTHPADSYLAAVFFSSLLKRNNDAHCWIPLRYLTGMVILIQAQFTHTCEGVTGKGKSKIYYSTNTWTCLSRTRRKKRGARNPKHHGLADDISLQLVYIFFFSDTVNPPYKFTSVKRRERKWTISSTHTQQILWILWTWTLLQYRLILHALKFDRLTLQS